MGWGGCSGSGWWSSPRPACSSEPRGADPPVKKTEAPAGPHVVSRLDTYRALEQHVLEGKALAHELMCLTRPALGLSNGPLPGTEVKRGQDGAGGGWAPA